MKLCLILLIAAALPFSKSTSQDARSRETAPTWRLVEDLRIGGEDDGPKSFSDIRGVLATRAGNIFVLDFKVQEIRVFDAKGNFLRRAARKGQGPGELANANGMAVGNDDVVWVNDPSNGRFSLFRADGTFLRQILLPINGYGFVWGGVIDDKGRAMDMPVSIPTSRVDPQTNRPARDYRMRFIRPDGTADTVALPKCFEEPTVSRVLQFQRAGGRGGKMMMSVPFLPRAQVTLTRKGTVWCTPSDEYRLWTGPAGGTLQEVVRLTLKPIPLPPGARKQALDRVDSIVRNYGPLIAGDLGMIPKTLSMIANLFADDQGRAWVRLTDTVATASFDVVDPTGKFIATLRSLGKVGTQVFIAGAMLLTVITNDDDIPMVVRYRIER